MSEDDLQPPDSAPPGPARPADVVVPARMRHLQLDPRGYPIIAVIPQDPGDVDFGAISEQRKLVLATYDLCAICALPFRDELRWQVSFDHELAHLGHRPQLNEAPVHEICALYAAQVCPFVSSPYARFGDPMRKGQRRREKLVLAGFERTSAVVGHRSQLQAGTGILMFEMAGLARTHELTGAADARAAYAEALRDEAVVDLDPAEKRLVDILSAPDKHNEDTGTVMAGGAWVIGAAFCPKVGLVEALTRNFRKNTYDQMAAAFVADPSRVAALTDSDDPSYAAAATWFTTRSQLPPLLQQWRTDGARRIRTAGSTGPVSPEAQRRRREAADKSRRRSNEKAARKQRRRGR